MTSFVNFYTFEYSNQWQQNLPYLSKNCIFQKLPSLPPPPFFHRFLAVRKFTGSKLNLSAGTANQKNSDCRMLLLTKNSTETTFKTIKQAT